MVGVLKCVLETSCLGDVEVTIFDDIDLAAQSSKTKQILSNLSSKCQVIAISSSPNTTWTNNFAVTNISITISVPISCERLSQRYIVCRSLVEKIHIVATICSASKELGMKCIIFCVRFSIDYCQ